MSARTRALGSLGLIVAATFAAMTAVSLSTTWVDEVALALLLAIGACSSAFAAIYMFTRPWWESNIGRALMASTSSLALLVDISLLYQWLGDDYFLRDAVRLTVFASVLIGTVYKCVSLVYPDRWRARSDTTLDR